MGITLHKRALAKAGDARATLDYPMLVALLNAAQGADASFMPPLEEPDAPPPEGSFVELIEGGPAWRRAILGQGGSFNPGLAERDRDFPLA